MTNADFDPEYVFSHHHASPEKLARYEALHVGAKQFAQIILEEERRKSGLLSLPVLREIIQHGEAALQGIAATVGSGMEAIRTAPGLGKGNGPVNHHAPAS